MACVIGSAELRRGMRDWGKLTFRFHDAALKTGNVAYIGIGTMMSKPQSRND
jgi:hypothetical protein